MTGVRAAAALSWREWVRFVRRPSRVVAALGTAGLFWLFLASGFGGSFTPASAAGANGASVGYDAYLIPGIATMVVMFAAVTWAIGLIQDRATGFLQDALVSPAPVWSVVLSKAGVGGLVAGAQGAFVLAGALVVAGSATAGGIAMGVCLLTVGAIGVLALCLALAWRCSSVAGFHGVMNLVLLPMWALSGAVFPVDGAAAWLRPLMLANPLTWVTESTGAALGVRDDAPAWMTAGVFVFAIASLVLAAAMMRRASGGARRTGEG
jgi:ABC-2 type transport system permease protein